ncbi:hypothetical protein [Polynucleobacter necessarius]|uniref:hypothetical protein n=1 Tax=Polynucleobacter necessarius TaxID=576610 RepID=UPI000E08E290|nr:hypothetical protein [Polynucleobacter necessarius]HAT39418.1 hypothetical protein [Polynucleobacter sp.]
MDVILETKDQIESDFKVFTENRVKFSLKRLFWLVRKIKVKYSSVDHAKSRCNQNCIIELQTFDNRQIEVSFTARDRRTALEMGLKKVYKHIQKAFNKAQRYGRLSRHVYV